jgi:hypothetical protein
MDDCWKPGGNVKVSAPQTESVINYEKWFIEVVWAGVEVTGGKYGMVKKRVHHASTY